MTDDRPRALRPPAAPPAGETGSAYVVTLLALVVLTILGLSLSLITQSELVIGANERVEKRTFYAADSGISRSLAAVLVNGEAPALTFPLDDAGSKLPGIRFDVAVSPFFPIAFPPCNLCQINSTGEYGGQNLRSITFAVTSSSTRRNVATGSPLAQKTVTAMTTIQPREATADLLAPVGDPDSLAMLKF